jgi:hypothetical protein
MADQAPGGPESPGAIASLTWQEPVIHENA